MPDNHGPAASGPGPDRPHAHTARIDYDGDAARHVIPPWPDLSVLRGELPQIALHLPLRPHHALKFSMWVATAVELTIAPDGTCSWQVLPLPPQFVQGEYGVIHPKGGESHG